MGEPFLTTDFFKDDDDDDVDPEADTPCSSRPTALSPLPPSSGSDIFAFLASPSPAPSSAPLHNSQTQTSEPSQRIPFSQSSQFGATQSSKTSYLSNTNTYTQSSNPFEEIFEHFENEGFFGTEISDELPSFIDPAVTSKEADVLEAYLSERSQKILDRIRDAILNLSVEATEVRNPKMLFLQYTLRVGSRGRLPAMKKERRMGSRLSSIRPLASKLRLLELIQKMILTRTHVTKRDLFYKHKALFGTQQYVDSMITDICQFLDATREDLFILSCSRGSVMGPMTLCTSNGIINCALTPTSIANNFPHAAMRTTADYVLIVEKDTVFQRLIDEHFFEHFPRVILVTGRGFPDFATRQFLKRVHDDLRLPMYTLMDCDPHGLHIAMTYKYGSSRKKVQTEGGADAVVLKNVKHIGFLPSQIAQHLGPLQLLPFNRSDSNKINMILNRCKEIGDTGFLHEAEILDHYRKKVELEALHAHSPHFIIEYLMQRQMEFPMVLNFAAVEKSTPALAKMYQENP